jgi:two-component system, NarL family, sensor kinase
MGTVERSDTASSNAARAALLLALGAVLLAIASLVLGLWLPADRRMVWWHPEILVAVIWTPTAALLLRHRPGLRVGWVMMVGGTGAGLYVLTLNLGPWFELHGWIGAGFLTWLGTWLWALDTFVLTLVLPLIFPDGRLVSRWFLPVLAAACATPVIGCVHLTIDPDVREFHNGVSVYPFQDMPLPISATILGTLALGLLSATIRFFRAAPDARRQMAWVYYPGVIALLIIYVGESAPIGDVVRNVTIAAIPICIAVAITRYRLFDIDLVVTRTLVYAGLMVVITGVYFALLGAAGLIAHGKGPVAGLAGAVAAGAVFEPARRRLQHAVDRLIHGERDPYRIADQLQALMQTAAGPSNALAVATEAVRQALHATGVRIEVLVRDGRPMSAESGSLGDRSQRVPLVWYGEPVGRLLFDTDPDRAPDPRLTTVLARNLAELANAAQVAADVQRSRERILRTREEERRRLRRDLHDGLGPTLASLAMTVDAARITLKHDPAAVDAQLESLRSMMGRAIGDVRELVYDLRPPALDDLGLAGAIRALGCVVSTGDGPKVDVEVEGDLTVLPAAAEVAAYRIVQEALTNVHRHAKAGAAVVRLHLNGDLYVTIGDDGVGLPADLRSGVGMSSMRERAAELGGSCTVGPGPDGGTLVRARLPLTNGRC